MKKGGQVTKPIILVKICYKLLYVIQGVETQVETQVWLKSVKKFDKGVNAQKESLKKIFQGSRKLPQGHEKVCDENETRKKTRAPKIFFDGRKEFIRHMWKTGVMDIKRLWVTDS